MKYIELTENPENHPGVALVEINRPEALNALSTPLMEELVGTLLELSDGDKCRVAVITGRGRAFAAGADVGEMAQDTPVKKVLQDNFRFWDQWNLVRIPLIGAVNGYALGGGCELAMACDIILASEEATFGQPEITLGTIPGAGGTQRLTRAIGKARASEMILTGQHFSAKEAQDWGLVSRILPAPLLREESLRLASVLAAHSPVALRLGVEAIRKASELSLGEGMDFERRNFYLTFASEDQKRGMAAFLEKRTPRGGQKNGKH